MIPRRIIQTGPTQILSPVAKAAAANLKLLHPEWEYCYFDDAEIRAFLRAEFPDYQGVFDAFPRNIQRIDFFRYLAIYRLGGFYFDLDVFLSKPLDDLLALQSVFTFEELTLNQYLREAHAMDWEIGNYAFGAAPEDPFLGAVIENCVRAQRDQAWVSPMMRGIPAPFASEFRVLNSTGPGLLTRTLAEGPSDHVTVLFPEDVCDPRSWHQFGDYGVHLMEGSWRSKGNYLFRRAAGLWENWTRKRLERQSRANGPTRAFPSRPTQHSAPSIATAPAANL
jgi:inositol phosphorylceramide mannosyltransferase catalytic subunit